MPRYRCATFHVLKTPVSFIGLSSSRRITVFLEANMKISLAKPWAIVTLPCRDAGRPHAPRTDPYVHLTAYGSYLGCLTANRWFGQG